MSATGTEPAAAADAPAVAKGAGHELREIRGPSAIGGGWRRFLDLLLLIGVSDFKKNYFGTVLGYLWSLLRPLIVFAVLLVVFTRIFRVGSDIDNYAVFLLFNIVLFGFFQEATLAATTSVVQQESIVRKTQFPRLVIPLATVVTAFLNLGANFVVVFVFMLGFGVEPIWTWLLFPLLVGLLLVLTSAMAALLSALYVRFRDVRIIWTVMTTVLFYGSAVLYPINIVPDGILRDALFLNPLVPLFVTVRHWVIDADAPSAIEAAGGFVNLLPAAAIFIGICAAAVVVFAREAPRVAEDL